MIDERIAFFQMKIDCTEERRHRYFHETLVILFWIISGFLFLSMVLDMLDMLHILHSPVVVSLWVVVTLTVTIYRAMEQRRITKRVTRLKDRLKAISSIPCSEDNALA